MEVSARLKGARISAQKARLVADQIRGQAVGSALNTLTFVDMVRDQGGRLGVVSARGVREQPGEASVCATEQGD